MNSPLTDYYKVLDLPQTATAAEVKHQYRELARRYHPDVNPSPDAAARIKAINEAHHHLGDPERRALYDAERHLRTASGAAKRTAWSGTSAPATDSQADRHAQRGPGGGQSAAPHNPRAHDAGYNGFGRVSHEAPRSASHASRTAPASSTNTAEADRLIIDAKLAYISRRYNEAERLCREAIELDRKQAAAHEILGDIFARRGDRTRATAAYSYAIQFNPRSESAQVKLEHILGRNARSRQTTITSTRREPAMLQMLRGPARDLILFCVSVAALTGFVVVLVVFYANQGVPNLTDELSLNLFAAMAAAGTFAGIILAIYGGMRPISHELTSTNRRPAGLGSGLVIASLIWFYASLIVFVLSSMRQNRISLSVARAYGVTILLIATFVCIYQPAHTVGISTQAAAFAGNMLFPAVLLGWRIGDWLRLGGA